MKKCSNCQTTKDLVKHSKRKLKDGTISRTYYCRTCKSLRRSASAYTYIPVTFKERWRQEVEWRHKAKQINGKVMEKYARPTLLAH